MNKEEIDAAIDEIEERLEILELTYSVLNDNLNMVDRKLTTLRDEIQGKDYL